MDNRGRYGLNAYPGLSRLVGEPSQKGRGPEQLREVTDFAPTGQHNVQGTSFLAARLGCRY